MRTCSIPKPRDAATERAAPAALSVVRRYYQASEIPPTGKSFDVDFYTVALWNDGQITEENLMYDLVTFMQQLGLIG